MVNCGQPLQGSKVYNVCASWNDWWGLSLLLCGEFCRSPSSQIRVASIHTKSWTWGHKKILRKQYLWNRNQPKPPKQMKHTRQQSLFSSVDFQAEFAACPSLPLFVWTTRSLITLSKYFGFPGLGTGGIVYFVVGVAEFLDLNESCNDFFNLVYEFGGIIFILVQMALLVKYSRVSIKTQCKWTSVCKRNFGKWTTSEDLVASGASTFRLTLHKNMHKVSVVLLSWESTSVSPWFLPLDSWRPKSSQRTGASGFIWSHWKQKWKSSTARQQTRRIVST